MEDTSNIISEKEAKLETLQQILNREAQEIGSFYGISKEKINKVADLPIREMSRKKAVHRLQKLTDINSPPALPEDETFDAVAEILGTSREKIIEKRKQQRKRELENISGYYCRKNEDEVGEIILLQSGEFSPDHVVRHELIHAFRGEYEPNNDLSDEREGVVEGLELFSRPGKEPESPKDFLKLRQEIISGEVEVGFPEDVIRFIVALGATYSGRNPLSVQEAAKMHFEDGDTLLSINIASRVPEKIRPEVSDNLLKLK